MLFDILDIFLSFLLLQKYNISILEKLVLSILLVLLEYKFKSPIIILLSRLYLLDRQIFFQILPSLKFMDFIYAINGNLKEISFLFSLVIFVLKIQSINCIKNEEQRVNLNRKLFHFLLFIVYFSPTSFILEISEYALLILIVTSRSEIFRNIFRPFLSYRDTKNLLVSHVYLFLSCLFPYYYLNLRDYRSTLISVCILDSLASIMGQIYKKQSKSLIGSISGILAGIFVNRIFNQEYNILYFVLTGIVEYIDIFNDNLSIPTFSVFYFNISFY